MVHPRLDFEHKISHTSWSISGLSSAVWTNILCWDRIIMKSHWIDSVKPNELLNQWVSLRYHSRCHSHRGVSSVNYTHVQDVLPNRHWEQSVCWTPWFGFIKHLVITEKYRKTIDISVYISHYSVHENTTSVRTMAWCFQASNQYPSSCCKIRTHIIALSTKLLVKIFNIAPWSVTMWYLQYTCNTLKIMFLVVYDPC